MLRLRLQSSGCGFVFELNVVNQLRNGSRVCVLGTELGADRECPFALQMAQWTRRTSGGIEQKSSRNGGLEPGT